jgi:hypothetical protein
VEDFDRGQTKCDMSVQAAPELHGVPKKMTDKTLKFRSYFKDIRKMKYSKSEMRIFLV